MEYTPTVIIAALIATSVLGLAKGGLSGAGTLATPILALAISPVQAAAILLPILIVQDVISVWAFRHSWNRRIVAVMLPGSLVGIVAGWALAEFVAVEAVMGAIGLISILFGLWRLWIERGGRVAAAVNSPDWVGTLFGAASGFTSQIAHAGGPPFQMWVTPKKLPHAEFAGTTAVLFAMINWAKVPAYVALGQFSSANLVASAWLVPVAVATTLGGVWVVRRMRGRTFYTLINVLLVGLGLKLLVDAIV